MRSSYWRGVALGLGAALVGGLAAAADEGPKVGDKAPDFELKGTDGKTYKLSDFRGKKAVVLAWFPKADTPGCTKECKSFLASGDALRALNVTYFTISVDPVADNQRFSAKFGFDYPILSDPDKATARAYGVLDPQRGVARRWTFYIDKEGVIREVDKSIKTDRAALDVVDKLKALGIAGKS